ncbi:MAG: hypothetical protein KBD78_01995 [Oligoflexales bacterium]|nr:hypothetical protein [Oligoflexales bacterium]
MGFENRSLFQDYLNQPKSEIRQSILKEMHLHGEVLTIDWCQDLLCLDLNLQEKKLILDLADSSSELEHEEFLTENLDSWHQDLAVKAVNIWAIHSNAILWHKMLAAFLSPYVSQRTKYTMLMHVDKIGGKFLVELAAKTQGLAEYSPAFVARTLQLAYEYNVFSQDLLELAKNIISLSSSQLHPDSKALLAAVYYCGRYAHEYLNMEHLQKAEWQVWPQLIQEMSRSFEDLNNHEKLKKYFFTELNAKKKNTKTAQVDNGQDYTHFLSIWPPVWRRAFLDGELIYLATSYLQQKVNIDGRLEVQNEIFSGCDPQALLEALDKCKDDREFSFALGYYIKYLPCAFPETLILRAEQLERESADSKRFRNSLPARFSRMMTSFKDQASQNATASLIQAIRDEQQNLIAVLQNILEKNELGNLLIKFNELFPGSAHASPDYDQRHEFFNLAFRGQNLSKKVLVNEFWGALCQAWSKPEVFPGQLGELARQQPYLFKLCYVKTLGRFKGVDQAVLKLLDFIRQDEEEMVLGLIHALSEIGTERAKLELINFLTRTNMSSGVRIELLQLLKKHDLTKLQDELRSSMNDLQILAQSEGNHEGLRDAIEAVASLLLPINIGTSEVSTKTTHLKMDITKLDEKLSARIEYYPRLSGEVRRALRTAEFFYEQISTSADSSAIDLSPLIDMQYKAMELLFRETYEAPCDRLLNQGILQRKLDLIGYARPIPSAMDAFEDYLSQLPVIKTIPFFSKFKLRKMLRGICQYKPGRRFTLDGLKAFALFFLCFSRRECKFQLQQLFDLGLNDQQLFLFCKNLHVFQDFRNRAAHEGFHPDAKSDMESLWSSTVEIISVLFGSKSALLEKAGTVEKVGTTEKTTLGEKSKRPEPIIIQRRRIS